MILNDAELQELNDLIARGFKLGWNVFSYGCSSAIDLGISKKLSIRCYQGKVSCLYVKSGSWWRTERVCVGLQDDGDWRQVVRDYIPTLRLEVEEAEPKNNNYRASETNKAKATKWLNQ